MPATTQKRPLLRYAIAIAASAVALGVVAAVEPRVGFIPLLLLPAIALVERYAGVWPAIVTTAICSLGSLYFVNSHPVLDQRMHDLTNAALFPAVAASVLYLMEKRRMQRRVVQEQLLELSTLLDSMPETVLIFSRDGRVVDANRAALEFGVADKSELLGRYYTELAALVDVQHQEQPISPADMAVTRALRGETVRAEPRTITLPTHSMPIEALVSASPMRSDDGEVIGALLVLRDVTELAQLQRRIADTERHLAIGQMASGLAHDFNNVLNTITQAVAVLQMNPDRSFEERRSYLEMIDRAARTGAEIIKRVREYIRGGSGELGPVDVPRALHQAVDLTEPMWRKRPEILLDLELKPVNKVRANASDLQRVFANLIINALHAMPAGGTLGLSCTENDGFIYIRVRDTGTGIPPEQQKKIFMPYYTTKPHGTGLGLSTAQRTILAQGGNIDFTSELGKGTTFTITLPAIGTRQKVAA